MGNSRIYNFNGQNGGRYITDTATYTGNFQAIYANSAVVIATLVSPTILGTLTSIAIPAGSTYYTGNATSVTLTSGTATLYNWA